MSHQANGTIVVKYRVRRRNFAHLAAYGSDRYISGDKGVEFYAENEPNSKPSSRRCSATTVPHCS
jgi:hypothetical protein